MYVLLFFVDPIKDILSGGPLTREPAKTVSGLRGQPQPADQIANRKRRGSSGGRPPAFDPVDYKNRNHVERSFNHGKQWRGFATRYDKLGIVYRGAAVLNAIIRWLQRLRDTP